MNTETGEIYKLPEDQAKLDEAEAKGQNVEMFQTEQAAKSRWETLQALIKGADTSSDGNEPDTEAPVPNRAERRSALQARGVRNDGTVGTRNSRVERKKKTKPAAKRAKQARKKNR